MEWNGREELYLGFTVTDRGLKMKEIKDLGWRGGHPCVGGIEAVGGQETRRREKAWDRISLPRERWSSSSALGSAIRTLYSNELLTGCPCVRQIKIELLTQKISFLTFPPSHFITGQ